MPTATEPRESTGWAPAKLILFGEHAVAYGAPALGVALSRGVYATLRPGRGQLLVTLPDPCPAPKPGGPDPEALVAAALGEQRGRLDVALRFDVPPQGGLGTSAALVIALLEARRELAPEASRGDDASLQDEVARIESLAHGRSSGLDPAIVLHGRRGPVWFRREADRAQVEVLPPPPRTELVLGMQAPHGGTARSVGRVAALARAEPELHAATMAFLAALAEDAKRALGRGEHARLGHAMNLAHGVLSGLGLVGPGVQRLAEQARDAGALGVKMTGAGGEGGALYALAPDPALAEAIAAAWRASGAYAQRETLGA